jgi:hypothetical protein
MRFWLMSRNNLIKSAEKYLRRKLTDWEIQELMRIAEAFDVKDNDVLWTFIVIQQAGYFEGRNRSIDHLSAMEKIPEKIKLANESQAKLTKENNKLMENQAIQTMNSLIDSFAPLVRKEITGAARVAMIRVTTGKGMISIWSGTLIVSFISIIHMVLAGRIVYLLDKTKNSEIYWKELGWQIILALAAPPLLGLAVYAIENDYSTESKFVGWLFIIGFLAMLLLPSARVMGWI